MIRHKSWIIQIVLWAVVGPGLLWIGCAEQRVRDYKSLTYPKLGDVTIPALTRVTLPNGIRLFLMEDHELPLVNMSVRIRTGSVYEPAEKIGLASITGMVMRTGGTTSKTGDELDEELESIARLLVGVDPAVPFTVLAFFPEYMMRDYAAPSVENMVDSYQRIRKVGLENVRLGNVGIFARTEEEQRFLIENLDDTAY